MLSTGAGRALDYGKVENVESVRHSSVFSLCCQHKGREDNFMIESEATAPDTAFVLEGGLRPLGLLPVRGEARGDDGEA